MLSWHSRVVGRRQDMNLLLVAQNTAENASKGQEHLFGGIRGARLPRQPAHQ